MNLNEENRFKKLLKQELQYSEKQRNQTDTRTLTNIEDANITEL